MQPWQRVDAIARQQHGAITYRQAVEEAGVCGRVLTERVRGQGWVRPYRGVYLMPGATATYQRAASAALLAVGGRVLLTGSSAAYLDGLVAGRPKHVELALETCRGTRSRSGLVLRRHGSRALEGSRQVQRLAVAGIPLMLADLARDCDDASLSRIIAALCARRLSTLAEIEAWLDSIGVLPGGARLRRVLAALHGELTHSGTERLLRRHVAQLGIEVWPRPFPVVHEGSVVAEIDLALPAVRYGAEVDGPHHLLPDQVASDKARDRFLGRIGWTIDRFGVDQVERTPHLVAREILARLATLGYAPPPPGS